MQQILVRLGMVVFGYLFGNFQTSYIYGKLHGIDIRQHGSGNAGTTNTLRVLGKKAGLIVFAGDVLKTMAAILIAKLVFKANYSQEEYQAMRMLVVLYTGMGAILGHNFPFYMHFKGGKGIASTAGIVLSLNWPLILVGVLSFFVPFGITNYVSLGSCLVYLTFMIEIIICGKFGFCGMQYMTPGMKIECYVIVFFLAAMCYYKHWANIKRLIKGEERKTYLFKKPKEENK